jgi:hypothetical protein
MELEVPKRFYFHAYVIRCHDPMGIAVGEVKDVHLLQMSGHHYRESRFF